MFCVHGLQIACLVHCAVRRACPFWDVSGRLANPPVQWAPQSARMGPNASAAYVSVQTNYVSLSHCDHWSVPDIPFRVDTCEIGHDGPAAGCWNWFPRAMGHLASVMIGVWPQLYRSSPDQHFSILGCTRAHVVSTWSMYNRHVTNEWNPGTTGNVMI